MNNVELLLALTESLIELFIRHSTGENVSADLQILQARVKELQTKEIRIAAGDLSAIED